MNVAVYLVGGVLVVTVSYPFSLFSLVASRMADSRLISYIHPFSIKNSVCCEGRLLQAPSNRIS